MAAAVQSNPASVAPPPAVGTPLDPAHLRLDFPLLSRMMGKQPLVYLDNAATSQKPRAVLEAMDHYYRRLNANVHRGIHLLSQEATRAFEEARGRLSRFIGAPEPATCVFTRNTTEALNLVAHAWARPRLKPGDRILLTDMEHHSNIVPWQLAAEACGARLDYVSFDRQGRLELDQLDRLLGPRTRVVAFTHVSNVLGTINPVADIVARARAVGAVTVVDGAQAVPHAPVDVRALGVDFYAFSGHKMCGPTGAGMLYGRRERLEEMGPFLGGGEMIERVERERSTFNTIPHRFEAGTPPIAEAIGMAAAADYLQQVGMERIHAYEMELVTHARACLGAIPGLHIWGPPEGERAGLTAFSLQGVHPHDLSTMLDQDAIAIRAGHHCTQILHQVIGEPATARASYYFYNTRAEIDRLAEACEKARTFFS